MFRLFIETINIINLIKGYLNETFFNLEFYLVITFILIDMITTIF